MEQSKQQLIAEIRYAQRLCERTARLYRRVQSTLTALGVTAGSGALLSISTRLEPEVTSACALVFALIGAIGVATRAADKVAQNEADVRKYANLQLKAIDADPTAIRRMLAEARTTDAPEIEPLRDIAFNDVMLEINREDHLIPLRFSQKLLGMLA